MGFINKLLIRSINKNALLTLAIVVWALTTLAARADTRYVWCSGSAPSTNTVYFSIVFSSDQGLSVGKFENDFTGYVSAHYSHNINATCAAFPDQASATKDLNSNLQLFVTEPEMTAVRTGWYEGLR
jgi:hypothetical protein